MTPPKKIYLYPDVGGKSLVKIWTKDQIFKSGLPYFNEEHIRAIADELYGSGDAFIAKLNDESFSKHLKGDEK
jgi:hypothetical protein